ncbi:MAG: hypothetical protein QY312_01705 [Candidatus Dojkabacteria bacterium]|nr:MAG: hypothetical protein QY312_01705 [Candidatus Dojkabacteria bacterium]
MANSAVLLNLFPLYATVFLSYLLKRYKVFPPQTADVLVPLVFKLAAPAVVFLALSAQTFGVSSLLLVLLGVISFFFVVGFFLISRRVISPRLETQNAFVLGGISFAVGTVAYPMLQLLFPSQVFAEAVIIDLTLLILFLSIAPLLVTRERNTSKLRETLLYNPILWAVYAGLAVSFIGISLPEGIVKFTHFAGDSFSFLAAVLLGVTIQLPNREQLQRVLLAVVLKNGAWIMLAWLIMLIPHIESYRHAFIMTIAAPVGIFPVIYAKLYGQDDEFAAQFSIVSVLFSLLIYPLLLWIIL